jgi:predicted protein tyrosine phosphatase
MKTKILILNRAEIFDYINTYDELYNIAFISINDTIGPYSESPLKNINNISKLILHFDDVIEDNQPSPTNRTNNTRSFRLAQAQQILSFIEDNKNKNFIVHCVAGISRSGAVGTFISNYLDNVDYEFFKKYNTQIAPNIFILTSLMNASLKKDEY